jgi:hypothetical protein
MKQKKLYTIAIIFVLSIAVVFSIAFALSSGILNGESKPSAEVKASLGDSTIDTPKTSDEEKFRKMMNIYVYKDIKNIKEVETETDGHYVHFYTYETSKDFLDYLTTNYTPAKPNYTDENFKYIDCYTALFLKKEENEHMYEGVDVRNKTCVNGRYGGGESYTLIFDPSRNFVHHFIRGGG